MPPTAMTPLLEWSRGGSKCSKMCEYKLVANIEHLAFVVKSHRIHTEKTHSTYRYCGNISHWSK
ncbi:hypothetical protein COLSTE_00354 [Collinsella stercoris DSM 13279]|uniref:Uncharacterized protein n=1 Tax=Collinsella stercoris DSM 13279 TaxID=445975 RepID=B6G8E6_9ACTN|nr:hypothetical protein COLSTE_00354 [Collinsella stercoris DSM 13279]